MGFADSNIKANSGGMLQPNQCQFGRQVAVGTDPVSVRPTPIRSTDRKTYFLNVNSVLRTERTDTGSVPTASLSARIGVGQTALHHSGTHILVDFLDAFKTDGFAAIGFCYTRHELFTAHFRFVVFRLLNDEFNSLDGFAHKFFVACNER